MKIYESEIKDGLGDLLSEKNSIACCAVAETYVPEDTSKLKKMEELQDAPIPSDIKQDEILKILQARVNGIEDDLEYFKRQMYNKQ